MRGNKYATDIVAYLTIVGWLIAYFCGDREESKFHLNQALVILLADLGLNAVFALETWFGAGLPAQLIRGVIGLLSFCVVALGILGLWRAIRGIEKPVPILGEVQLLK